MPAIHCSAVRDGCYARYLPWSVDPAEIDVMSQNFPASHTCNRKHTQRTVSLKCQSLRALPACSSMKLMRGRAVFVLLGLTALGAYSVGRQSAPVSNEPV